MTWTFDGSEWRAQGTYAEYRVYPDRMLAGWRGEQCETRRGQPYEGRERPSSYRYRLTSTGSTVGR